MSGVSQQPETDDFFVTRGAPRAEGESSAWPFGEKERRTSDSQWEIVARMSPERKNQEYWRLCYGDDAETVLRTIEPKHTKAPPSKGM